MKKFSFLAVAAIMSLSLGIGEAEAAKRLGGGGSSGMQRQMSAPPSKAPAAAPAPTPAAPTSAAAAPAKAPTPAVAPTPGRSWMGPLAGLAAGIGLAALASHFGFGEELASFMMMALIGLAVMMVVGYFLRKRMASQQPALAGAGGTGSMNSMHYAATEPVSGSQGHEPVLAQNAVSATGNIPADFDVAGFVRNAKVHYIRLQAANDTGNLDDIREFTTPEMFAEIKLSIGERSGATQETDVVRIEAEMLEVVEEGNRYIASVRFSGEIREDRGQAEAVDEIWHLVKPRSGSSGWLLAGIQQIQ